MEAAISELLPDPSGEAPRRQELLARIDEYSRAVVAEARRLGPRFPGPAECERALEWLLRPVLICGHHRSGTTLLQNLLDGHPDLLSLPSEATYFSSFRYVAEGKVAEHEIDRFARDWIARFVDPNFEPHFRLGLSGPHRSPGVEFVRAMLGWREGLQLRVPDSFVSLFALVAAFRDVAWPECEPRAWVEKTPRNERYAIRYAPFGAVRFIHVVRDPRSTLASFRGIYLNHCPERFDAHKAACEIGQSLRLARRNASWFGDSYLVIRYEMLVENSAEEMDRIRRFLNIPPHLALLRPTAGGREVAANSSFELRAGSKIHPLRPTAALPADELALLASYAGKEARRQGYDLAVPGPVTTARIRIRQLPNRVAHLGRALFREVQSRLR